MNVADAAMLGAETIHQAFVVYHDRFRELTLRARECFEARQWQGVRQATVERLDLHGQRAHEAHQVLRQQVGDLLASKGLWLAMKEAYTRDTLGRDDYELAQTFFNSLARKAFPHDGVDAGIDFTSNEFPLPYRGWELASARVYATSRVDSSVVRRVLLDSGLRARFRSLRDDCDLAAALIDKAVEEHFGGCDIEALDVLRPVLVRNKAAYIVGRLRLGNDLLPVILALLHLEDGLVVDAVIASEATTSTIFSFARWYFHAEVASPREVIGFLQSILPRKTSGELYISLGYNKHGKTELYRGLKNALDTTDEKFVTAPGEPGLVMSVFTLPSFDFVFKVIKDTFPPSKATTRQRVIERYREVLRHDRVGRLVDFQEFEHVSLPRRIFSDPLLEELTEVAGRTVERRGDEVLIRHMWVGRRVVPLDIYLDGAAADDARIVVAKWGDALKDLAAANIFAGDMLRKNFGVTRHGRVVFYDYDELAAVTDCNFRRMPTARSDFEEFAAEPWFTVGENDVFPEEFSSFLDLTGELREAFMQAHPQLFELDFWRQVKERHKRLDPRGVSPVRPRALPTTAVVEPPDLDEDRGIDVNRYEFDESQNEIIAGLAQKMRAVALFSLLLGVVALAGAIFAAGSGDPAAASVPLLVGLFLLSTGLWTLRTQRSFSRIVTSKGHDIDHVMAAFHELRRFYTLKFWLIVVCVVLLLISVLATPGLS